MSNLFLKENPALKDFQDYVREMKKERGFEKENVLETFMLMSEEIGEMAKAIRKSSGIKVDENSHKPDLELEMADVFIYLLAMSNHFNIDLEKAFREKEEINKKRIWK